MGYKEFEIDTIGHGGDTVPFSFNLSNISYYRPFVDKSESVGVKDGLVTMVFLVGSIKAIKVKCSYESFKNKIKELQGT